MVDISSFHKRFTPTEDGNELFVLAAQSFGLDVKFPAIDTGAIQRVDDHENKRAHNKNGWYTLAHEDGIYFGAYGSWSRGEQQSFCSIAPAKLTVHDASKIKARQKAMKEEADKLHAAAAQKAENVIESAPVANANHPYLLRKRVGVHGIFQQGENLILPAYAPDGHISTYQSIAPDGKKRFLKDGAQKGTFLKIGTDTPVICVAEGYATAATIHEITGKCVYVAWSAGNLINVCQYIREAHKGHDILVCADNDQWTLGAGLREANKCASAVSGVRVVSPTFKNTLTEPTDFNDLFCLEGEDAVLIQLGEKRERIKAKPLGLFDPTLIPRREFLYGNHLIRKFCSTTISPGGVGKTQLVMTDAIAMVSGIKLLHDYPHEKVRAWHYNLEDPMDELMRRAVAICQHHRLDIADFADDLFLNSGRDQNLIVLEKGRHGEYARPHADELYQAIKENGISSLSIDPFVRTHHADENSNKDIDEVLKIFGQIANDTNCAIDLVHHVRKGKTGESGAGNIEMARGASSLSGAVRSARTLCVMDETEADALGIEAERRTWYLRVDNAKSNMAPPADKTDWLERHSVELPNGDHVGVVGTWKPPSLFDNVRLEDIKELMGYVVDNFVPADMKGKDNIFDITVRLCNVPYGQAQKMVASWLKSGKLRKQKEINPETQKSVSRIVS